jgi:hypothetical protein
LDYRSPLPEFTPDVCRLPAARPEPASWPAVGAAPRTFTRHPELAAAWQRWRGYVFGAAGPLSRRERRLLAAAAAAECCDGWQARELADSDPVSGAEAVLVAFARKLSSRPWQMAATDLAGLRDAGYPEPALLHAISVVALQNAESRLAFGLAALSSPDAESAGTGRVGR